MRAWASGAAHASENSESIDKVASNLVGGSSKDAANPGARDSDKASPDGPSASDASSGHRPVRRRRLLLGVAALFVLGGAAVFGVPWVRQSLNTVSTDDAFVNGHVTLVAPRVAGQVSRVLVDDNNRVRKGDRLVELDKEPYETAVAVKKAAVDIATANLAVAEASVRSIEAKARSQYWALKYAMDDVQNRIALLHAKVAALNKSKATLRFAQAELERAKSLVNSSAVSREEYDRRETAQSVARADVIQALEDAHQIRVSLGLPAEPEDGGDLGQVPADLDQTFSAVRKAQTELMQSAAELGVFHSYNQAPKQMLDEFARQNPQGDVDQILAQLVPANAACKCLAVEAVAIANEVIWDRFPPAGLADLPSDPFRGRRPCDANPKISSAVMSED